jgi:hypothetical protein
MREFLARLVGKKVEVFCGGTSNLSGKVVKVDESVLQLVDDDDRVFYIAINRIAVVSESKEREKNAGFVSGFAR